MAAMRRETTNPRERYRQSMRAHLRGARGLAMTLALSSLLPLFPYATAFASPRASAPVNAQAGAQAGALTGNRTGVSDNQGIILPSSSRAEPLAVRRNNNRMQNPPGPTLHGGLPPIGNKKIPDAPPSSFPLAVRTESFLLAPTVSNLRTRIEALRERPDVAEPIVLRFNTLESAPILEQLARQGIAERLLMREGPRLRDEFRARVLDRVVDMRLSIGVRDLQWIDLNKLASTLAQTSIRPFLSAKEWAQVDANPQTRVALEEHLGESGRDVRARITSYLNSHPRDAIIPMDTFLPPHMRALLGRFSPLRGRNCFATALNFNDPRVESMKNINLVREEGHHAALINNDEFAEALWLGYRELTRSEIAAGMHFGDVVAFDDATEGGSYVGLKHAAVHIAGDVYLHKPSKSASTPIEFVRWADIAKTWTALTRELDYKVYRRLPTGSLRTRNSQIAIEKIYWSQ